MSIEEFNKDWLALQDGLYRIAYYMLESSPDAEDAVQDLYVKLWNSQDTLEHIHNPQAYCVTLLKRLCIDRIRKAGAESLDSQELESEERGAEQALIEKEKLTRVQELMGRLPAREREVLRLRILEEMSYEQIARKTGINYLTLRVLLSNARRKLKAAL